MFDTASQHAAAGAPSPAFAAVAPAVQCYVAGAAVSAV